VFARIRANSGLIVKPCSSSLKFVAKIAVSLVSLTGCACGRAPDAELPVHRWAPLYADSSYRVAFDTAHVRRDGGGVYLTWIETRHARLEHENGHPFNREIIRNFLRCDPLSFKTVGVMLSLDDGPVVVWQGGDVRAGWAKPWKPTIPSSVDEGAMSRQCALLGEIARR
jgi:hypothetical protein